MPILPPRFFSWSPPKNKQKQNHGTLSQMRNFSGDGENLARKFCFKGLPLQSQSAVPFRLPNGPPLPRYLVPGLQRCGQRQNGWEGGLGRGKEGCRAKEIHPHPCLSQWLIQAPGEQETGVGRMTEAEARHNQVSRGEG